MLDRNSSTYDLEQAVEDYWCPNPFMQPDDFLDRLIRSCVNHCKEHLDGRYPCQNLLVAFCDGMKEQYEADRLYDYEFERQRPTDPVEVGRYRDYLLFLLDLAQYKFFQWHNAYFQYALSFFAVILDSLPEFAFVTLAELSEPSEKNQNIVLLIDAMETEAVAELAGTLHTLFSESYPAPAFFTLATQMGRNQFSPDDMVEALRERMSARDIVQRYLSDTPFLAVFGVPIPLPQEKIEEEVEEDITEPRIDERAWYTHCLFLAQTGRGKTNGIRWRINQLLPQIAEGRASLIVMEPKGVLCRNSAPRGCVEHARSGCHPRSFRHIGISQSI